MCCCSLIGRVPVDGRIESHAKALSCDQQRLNTRTACPSKALLRALLALDGWRVCFICNETSFLRLQSPSVVCTGERRCMCGVRGRGVLIKRRRRGELSSSLLYQQSRPCTIGPRMSIVTIACVCMMWGLVHSISSHTLL